MSDPVDCPRGCGPYLFISADIVYCIMCGYKEKLLHVNKSKVNK